MLRLDKSLGGGQRHFVSCVPSDTIQRRKIYLLFQFLQVIAPLINFTSTGENGCTISRKRKEPNLKWDNLFHGGEVNMSSYIPIYSRGSDFFLGFGVVVFYLTH